MRRESLLYGLFVAGVVAGLAILLAGEFEGADTFVFAGGIVILLSVGGLTALVAALPGAETGAGSGGKPDR
jgi:uncharacterized membrane protein YgaE (UPF0421/DUF939 family)